MSKLRIGGRKLVDKDSFFCNMMNHMLRQLEVQNPRQEVPQPVLTRVPENIPLEDAVAEGRDARVAYVLDKVAINSGRGFDITPKADGKLSDKEGLLIATLTPNAQSPHYLRIARALYPNPEHEGLKYVLMLRDTYFSDRQIMELGLFLAPWYGLTSNSKSRLQGEILKQAKRAVDYNDIEPVPLTQNLFTLDDMYGFGHALAVSRQIMERDNQDRMQENEQLLFVHHLFQNYDLSRIEQLAAESDELRLEVESELEARDFAADSMDANSEGLPFAAQMVKLLPGMLRADLLYHDAALHYLAGLNDQDFTRDYAGTKVQDRLVEGTMQTLRSSSLRGFRVSAQDCRKAVTKTVRAVNRFYQAITEAREIYQPQDLSNEVFVQEATPILRAFGQFFLGIPYRDTFGPGGSRGPEGTPKRELMPTLFRRLYHLEHA